MKFIDSYTVEQRITIQNSISKRNERRVLSGPNEQRFDPTDASVADGAMLCEVFPDEKEGDWGETIRPNASVELRREMGIRILGINATIKHTYAHLSALTGAVIDQ